MKVNTTLTTLNLGSVSEQKEKKISNDITLISTSNETGNEISDEGASALGEALKVNTTLAKLRLESAQHQQ